jgi:hypothetical protein
LSIACTIQRRPLTAVFGASIGSPWWPGGLADAKGLQQALPHAFPSLGVELQEVGEVEREAFEVVVAQV